MPHFLEPLVDSKGEGLALYLEGHDAPIAARVEAAFSSAARRRGLLGRESMPRDLALAIAPCNAIHTFRMQFAIDVIYAARDGRVVKVRHGVGPGRVSGAVGAFATIELAAGALDGTGIEPGQRLRIAPR